MNICTVCFINLTSDNSVDLRNNLVLDKTGDDLIKLHLSFINKSQEESICMMCWESLKTFHEFYARIFENHESTKNIIHIKIKEEQDIDSLQSEDIEEPFYEPIKDEPPEKTVKERKKSIKLAKEKIKKDKIDIPKDTSSYDDERIKETAIMSCDLCSIKLESFTNAKSHFKKSHKGIKGYLICCGKKYIKKYRLLTHLNSHYNVSFPCKACGKTFSSKQCLGRHMISHETLKLFECDKCPKSFAKKFQVRNHLQNVHVYEKVVPSFKCHFEDCSKIFVNNLRLQHHLKYTHEGGDQVICEICSKTFKKRSSLDEHMRIHTRKPCDRYQCEICGHYIADIRVFQRHVKNHATESLNNTCHYCGKKSPNLKALKGHIRYVHELERNFQCRFCEKRFKTSRNLKDHEASVHTLEELYECSFCPRTFRNHSNMLSHRKNQHPEHYQGPVYTRDVI
ncbi:unnamed protein product [Chironomus riparius]|uniref:C2H2-type domain-containing protein n=1 Tax=Chironomus riparius TaxID=315576 RepID=A0A9N9WM59_9DIPT|nr:unnamed protein product [Chironomus riparius]